PTRRSSDLGGSVRKGWRAKEVVREGERVRGVLIEDAAGVTDFIEIEFLLSSAPLTELVEMMKPLPPDEVLAACRSLRFREHLGVQLQVDGSPFPDNWIYVHSKDVQMARVSNYRNFSPEMSDVSGKISPLTVEYFTFRDHPLWNTSDDALISLATAELKRTD